MTGMTPPLSNQLLRTQSDRRLRALVAAGHDRAFEAIVERYRRPLSRYLRRLLSEPLTEDVLQTTFVRAWQALAGGAEVRDLRPWLYRIAHNQAVNALRAAGPGDSELPDALAAPQATAAPDVAAERSEELRSTLRGITALPDRQRAALMGVAVDDRAHADVAAELGLSDGALRQLLLRARTALRAAATALTPYPVVSWLSAGSEVSAARVAEVAAGAGGIGVAVKAGAAVLAAGAVVAGAPALRDEGAMSVTSTPSVTIVRGEAESADTRPTPSTVADRSHSSDRGSSHRHARSSGSSRHHRGRSEDERRGGSEDEDRSGSVGDERRSGDGDRTGSSGSVEDRSGSDGEDRSGPSGSDDEGSSFEDSGSGESGDD
jgi:RNA polymerase sigma factor (sigma-70 family)